MINRRIRALKGSFLSACAVVILVTSSLYYTYHVTTSSSWDTRHLQPHRECLGHAFEDIILVIVYNHPPYYSVPVLKALYSKAFHKILFYGPTNSSKYGVTGMDIHKGYFGYECLSDAIRRNPKNKGYFFVSDDVVVNYWNLASFDKEKIWEGPTRPIQVDNYYPPTHWYWWNSTWGVKQCHKAYHDVTNQTFSITSWNVNKSLSILVGNTAGTEYCARGRSDVFYIPGKFARTFEILSSIFYRHKVFLEIAVPTILRMLDLKKNMEYIPGIYLPGKKNESPVRESQYFWRLYTTKLGFLHPLKLLYFGEGVVNHAILNHWVIDYVNTLYPC